MDLRSHLSILNHWKLHRTVFGRLHLWILAYLVVEIGQIIKRRLAHQVHQELGFGLLGYIGIFRLRGGAGANRTRGLTCGCIGSTVDSNGLGRLRRRSIYRRIRRLRLAGFGSFL